MLRFSPVSIALGSSALLALLLATSANAAINISVTVGGVACDVAGDDCPAPQALFFDATATSCSAGECGAAESANNSFRNLQYSWDFGDPGKGTWPTGAAALETGQDKNVEYGPVAFHVYDTPGTFNGSVTVTDGTTTSVENFTVEIDDPDLFFAGTLTRCISTSGTFTNCPSGASTSTSTLYGSSVNAAITAGARRILFREGETLSAGGSVSLGVNGPVQIGVFGASGTNVGRATINAGSGNNHGCDGKSRWTWVNLDVNKTGSSGRWFVNNGAVQDCSDLLFYRIEATNVFKVVTQAPRLDVPSDVFWVADGQIVDGINTDNYPCWLTAAVHGGVFAGIDFREGCEREIRISHGMLSPDGTAGGPTVISHNSFPEFPWGGQGGWIQHNLDIRGYSGDPETGTGGHRYLLISDNLFRSPRKLGMDFRSAAVTVDQELADAIVERNRFNGSSSSVSASMIRNTLVRRLTVRNNIVFNPKDRTRFYSSYLCPGCDAGWKKDNLIANNSFYATVDMTAPLVDIIGSQDSNSTCQNNVAWNTQVADEEICPTATTNEQNASRNANEDVTITKNPFMGSPPDAGGSITGWQRNSDAGGGAALSGAGTTIPAVLRDFRERVRPAGGYDIGAMQSSASVPPPAAPPAAPILLD